MTLAPAVRLRVARPLVAAGVALAVIYAVAGTWSVGRTFGGESDDGGWVDASGAPTSVAPPQVQVTGHPALWVDAALIALLIAGGMWASRAQPGRARRRTVVAVLAAALFVGAVIAVFTLLQMHLVADAFDRGLLHPPILGNATVTVGHLRHG